MLPQRPYSKSTISREFSRYPGVIWVNSFGGCRSNLIAQVLEANHHQVKIPSYQYYGCHYYKPLNSPGVGCGIFCFVSDLGLALTSQIKRNFHRVNFCKNSGFNNTYFSLKAWLTKIEQQITNWTQPERHYVPYPIILINTDHLEQLKPQISRHLGLRLSTWPVFKPRSSTRWHASLLPYRTQIQALEQRLQQLPPYQLYQPQISNIHPPLSNRSRWRAARQRYHLSPSVLYNLEQENIKVEDYARIIYHWSRFTGILLYPHFPQFKQAQRPKHVLHYHQLPIVGLRLGSHGVLMVGSKKIKPPRFLKLAPSSQPHSGLEDPRAFIFQNNLYLLTNGLLHNGTRRMILYNHSQRQWWSLTSDLPRQAIEKNWTPLLYGGHLCFLYSLTPRLILLKFNPQTGHCSRVWSKANPTRFPFFGSSALLRYRKHIFRGLAHTRDPFRTVFYQLNLKNWSFTYSKPFTIASHGPTFWGGRPLQRPVARRQNIQYAYDLQESREQYWLYISCFDQFAMKIQLPKVLLHDALIYKNRLVKSHGSR